MSGDVGNASYVRGSAGSGCSCERVDRTIVVVAVVTVVIAVTVGISCNVEYSGSGVGAIVERHTGSELGELGNEMLAVATPGHTEWGRGGEKAMR